MDENSCENETSDTVDGQKAKETKNVPRLEDVGVRIDLDEKKNRQDVSDRYIASLDPSVSGPSSDFAASSEDREEDTGKGVEPVLEQNLQEFVEASAPMEENGSADDELELPSYEVETRVRLAPEVQEELSTRRPSVGPPPSYSFVMKQKKRKLKYLPSPDPLIIDRPPPPTYASSDGVYMPPEERVCTFHIHEFVACSQRTQLVRHISPDMRILSTKWILFKRGFLRRKLRRFTRFKRDIQKRFPKKIYQGALLRRFLIEFLCLASFGEPIWRSHSQPALCPRCGILVLTTTHSHDSVATHVAALALCLFGCWPCCLLPYCMNICKNTYHHCPICQTFLGLYRPW